MGRDGRHRRNSTRPGRWARSLDVDEEAPVAASSTGNSTGTSYQALLLTPGRYVRLFESCGDLKAGVPGIIVPDEVPAVDTGRPPVEGELPSVPVLASRQCHPGEASDSVQMGVVRDTCRSPWTIPRGAATLRAPASSAYPQSSRPAAGDRGKWSYCRGGGEPL